MATSIDLIYLQVFAAHDAQLLVVVGGAGVGDQHDFGARRLQILQPRLQQLILAGIGTAHTTGGSNRYFRDATSDSSIVSTTA